MRHSIRLARAHPVFVIGAAGLVGWLLGSGTFALPFSLPSLPSVAPHPTSPTSPASPATLPVSQGQAATLTTSSASMPPAASAPTDPLAGWSI